SVVVVVSARAGARSHGRRARAHAAPGYTTGDARLRSKPWLRVGAGCGDIRWRSVESARPVRPRVGSGRRGRALESPCIRLDVALDSVAHAAAADAWHATGHADAAGAGTPRRRRRATAVAGGAATRERSRWRDRRRRWRSRAYRWLRDRARYARRADHRATRLVAGESRHDRSPLAAARPPDVDGGLAPRSGRDHECDERHHRSERACRAVVDCEGRRFQRTPSRDRVEQPLIYLLSVQSGDDGRTVERSARVEPCRSRRGKRPVVRGAGTSAE